MLDLSKEEAAALLCEIDDRIIKCSRCPLSGNSINCSSGEKYESAITKLQAYIEKVEE